MPLAPAWVVLGAALAGGPTPPPERCPSRGGAWVRVGLEELGAVETAVLEQLRSHLAARGIEVCLAGRAPVDAPTPPAAIVRVRGLAGEVQIEVDHAPGVHVARVVETSRLPSDGRALGIAVAIDETMRAAWGRPTPPPPVPAARPVPPPVPVVAVAAAAAPRRYAVAIGITSGAWSGGLWELGPVLSGSAAFASWGGAEVHVGFLWARPLSAPDGEVGAQAGVAGGALVLPLGRRAPDRFALLGGVDARWVSLAGDPEPGAQGFRGGALGVALRLAFRAQLPAFGTRLLLEPWGGAALRAVHALDGTQRVGGLQGLGGGLLVGVGTP